jgi:putative ABC transport system ATP-binding protein
MALVAQGIGRSFRQVEVLRGVDLAVAPGEFVTIGGPSGSGKSALLSILCGFDRPDVGSVLIRDVELDGAPSWQRCAVLPQALGLAGELTLAENTALPLLLTGSSEARARSLAVLRRVADRGTAVIAATHDPRVHAVADRQLRLDKGRLVA